MSVATEDFTVIAYAANLERIGWVGDPTTLTLTPRHNQQPTGSVTLPAAHRMVGALSAPGTRVVAYYRDEYLLGGPVRLASASGTGPQQTFTFQIIDDFRILSSLLGWPVPGSAITAQSGAEYDVRTGPAETVLKGFVSANLARVAAALPHTITVAASAGRGTTITVQSRMHPLADRLFPVVDQAGIGVTVRQTLTGLEVDCYTPSTFPLLLSQDGGTLTSLEWTLTPPSVSRVVVGFDGDAAARVFRQYVNTAAEAAYGVVCESFVDARDLQAADPNFEALAAARGAEALAAGAATAGLSLKLAETAVFRYGGAGVHVGDLLTVELAPGTTPVTDVLRSATLTWSPETGANITPVVGDHTDDPTDTLVRAVSTLAKGQRNRNAGG